MDPQQFVGEALPPIQKDLRAFAAEKSQGQDHSEVRFDAWLKETLVDPDAPSEELEAVVQGVARCNESYLLSRKDAIERIETAARAEENRKGELPPLPASQREAEILEAVEAYDFEISPDPDGELEPEPEFEDFEDEAIRVLSPEASAMALQEARAQAVVAGIELGPEDSTGGDSTVESTVEFVPADLVAVESSLLGVMPPPAQPKAPADQPPRIVATHATVRIGGSPVAVGQAVSAVRRRLAKAAPGADARIFEDIRRLEDQLAEMSETLAVLKAQAASSNTHLNEVRNLLTARAVGENILPVAASTCLDDDPPVSNHGHPGEGEKGSTLEQPRHKHRKAMVVAGLSSLAALFLAGVLMTQTGATGGALPNSERLAAARRAAQQRATYLRSEKHELELLLQVSAEADRLCRNRQATLERVRNTPSANPEAIRRAEVDLQEAEAIRAEVQPQSQRAEANLRRIAAVLPNG